MHPRVFKEFDRLCSGRNIQGPVLYFGSLFGEKNLHTYLYEEFREDGHAFLTRFINAHKLKPIQISSTETKTNRRFAKPLISFMRLANHLYRKNTLRKNYLVNLPFLYPTILHLCLFLNKYTVFHALSKTKNIFGAQQVSLINSYYLESNNRLQALLGKDKLVKYHYIDEK